MDPDGNGTQSACVLTPSAAFSLLSLSRLSAFLASAI